MRPKVKLCRPLGRVNFSKLWLKLSSKVRLCRPLGGANFNKLSLKRAPKVKLSKAWQNYLLQALRQRLELRLQPLQLLLLILVLDVKTVLRRALELLPSTSLSCCTPYSSTRSTTYSTSRPFLRRVSR